MMLSLPFRERWLGKAAVFNLFTRLIGLPKSYRLLVKRHLPLAPGARVLDLGCGLANILDYLPDVHYVGLDQNANYILEARRRYGKRATFLCQDLRVAKILELESFDCVFALGILHHLQDNECLKLLTLAHQALKPGGRLITYDGCFIEGQSALVHWLLTKDRGAAVRTSEGYYTLAKQVFPETRIFLSNDFLYIPYDIAVMDCTK